MKNLYRHWLCIRSILPILQLCRFSVIMVVIGAAALIFVEQVQEALRALVKQSALMITLDCSLLAAGVIMWAFYSAYCARVILYIEFPEPPKRGPCADRAREEAPRLLGVAPILAMAAALFISASDAPHGLPTYLLYGLAIICAGAAAPFYAFLKYRLAQVEKFSALPSRYVARLRGTRAPAKETTPAGAAKNAPVADHYRGLPADTRQLFQMMFAFSVFCFIIFTFMPIRAGQAIGAVTILLLALAAWIPFGTVLVYVTERYRTPPLMTIMLIWALALSYFFDNHEVRTLDKPAQSIARKSLEEHSFKWMERRLKQIDGSKGAYPVFFVAAEGGGIRAAYWTASTLAMLDDQIGVTPNGDRFSDHVFAISGVSGGSLGAAVYAGLVAERQRSNLVSCERPARERVSGKSLQNCAHNALNSDFLAPTVATLLYPDLVYRFLPIIPQNFSDRAVTLESAWEASWHNALPNQPSNLMGVSFDELWADDRAFKVPSLFLNGTSVETGSRMIMSNLRVNPEDPTHYSDFSDAYDMQEMLGKPVQLSTAVHMSARFTYVSPAGTVTANGKPVGHIVDGGYFENSGASTAEEVMTEFMKVFRESFSKKRIVPVVILLSNNPDRKFDNCGMLRPPLKPKKWATEVLAPLDALLQAREARGSYAEDSILTSLGNTWDCARFALRDDGAPLPLGWTLSSDARTEIDRQARAYVEDKDGQGAFGRVCARMGVKMVPRDKWTETQPRCTPAG